MRSIRRAAPLGGILGVAAIVVFASAGTALAAKPKATTSIQQVSQALTLPPQATNAGVAEINTTCPAGTAVVGGGGLYIAGTPFADNTGEIFESGPRDTSWHLRYNNNQAVPQSTTAHAICLKNKLKVTGIPAGGGKATAQAAAKKPKAITGVQQVAQTLSLPPDATNFGNAEATVNCPTGTTLIGGGLLFAAGTPLTDSVRILESGPVGNGWHGRYNNNDATAKTTTLQALCMKSKLNVKGSLGGGSKTASAAAKKPTARSSVQQITQNVQLPADVGGNNGVAQFDVPCPAGTTVVGGGGLFPIGTALQENIEMFESGAVGNSWHVRFNNNIALAQAVTVHASCLKNKLKVK